MNVFEIRLTNLNLLIQQYGTLADLNKKLGRSAKNSLLYQIKNQSINPITGKSRRMGERLARKIEEKLNLEQGYMDEPHNEKNNASAATNHITESSLGNLKVSVLGSSEEDLLTLESIALQQIIGLTKGSNLHGYLIPDDSMGETVPVCSVIFVDKNISSYQRDGIYLFKLFDQLVLKSVTRSMDGVFTVKDSKGEQTFKSLEKFQVAGMARYIWKGQAL